MKDGNNIEKTKKKMLRYQRNLYTTFLVSLLIPILIAVTAFLIYTNRSMEKRERQDMRNILDSVSRNIELQFTELSDVQRIFYSENKVFQEAECLNNFNLYQYHDSLTRSQMEKEYTRTITKLIHTSSQSVRSVVFFPVNEKNNVGYYIGKNCPSLKKIFYPDYNQTEWFTEALAKKNNILYYGPHSPSYLPDRGKKEVYSCVSAIRNMDTKRVIGVLKIDADIEHLQESLDILEDQNIQGFYLTKGDGLVLKSSGLTGDDLLDDPGFQKESLEIPNTGLKLTYLYSKSTYYRGYIVILCFVLMIIAVGMLLSFGVYRSRMKEAVEDVRQITEVTEKIGQGDLKSRIRIQSKNELEEIAEVMNSMMDNLQNYIDKEYLLVIQNQKAEYRALQSQINPHFLYNTLNGFVALNRMGEKKALEKSIISLSHLFQYTCKAQDIMDVQSEFAFLEEYLELEKLKYEQRLEYIIWMDEECRNKPLPKLLLQPIVENSIVHGMGMSDEPIMIKIFAANKEVKGIGRLTVITIRDNGCGYDSKKAMDRNSHVGIKNVQERAELFCKDVIYQTVSERGKGTKTTFIFPDA